MAIINGMVAQRAFPGRFFHEPDSQDIGDTEKAIWHPAASQEDLSEVGIWDYHVGVGGAEWRGRGL